jgi:hypothetical protein
VGIDPLEDQSVVGVFLEHSQEEGGLRAGDE